MNVRLIHHTRTYQLTFFCAVFAVDVFLAGAADFTGFLAGALAVVFFGAAFFTAGTVAAFLVVVVTLFFVAAGFFALDAVVVFLEGASAFFTGVFLTTGFFAGTGFEFLNVR